LIERFGLEQPGGLSVQITNFGCIVMRLEAPDRTGAKANVVLGFDSVEPYLAGHPFLGSVVGRVAGRLTGGRFEIDGRQFALAVNQPPNHLHGGKIGWDRRVWTPRVGVRPDGEILHLSYRSPAGEEGYPGTVDATVSYSLRPDRALQIDYQAVTDAPTLLSLTNHSYFNLEGPGGRDIRSHVLEILCDEFAPVDAHFSFTGERASVAGRANDFRVPARIGDRLDALFGRHGDVYLVRDASHRDPGLGPGKAPIASTVEGTLEGAVQGSVSNTKIDPRKGPGEAALVARVREPGSGRILEVLTTERCLQFYTGVSLAVPPSAAAPRGFSQFQALCLECHGFPDAPHHPQFDSIVLRPGQAYRQTTIYRFSTDAD
jgi:aldose 1-epimerase